MGWKPAPNQEALNPILYLKLTDPTTAHINAGTGGNFTLNGTIARSGRGPNQYNAAYSDLDGAADYLSTTAITGIADGKAFTFHCVINNDTPATLQYVFWIATSTTQRFQVVIAGSAGDGELTINGNNSSGTNILTVDTPNKTIVSGRNTIVTISLDLTSTSNRHVYVNGSAVSATWSTYTNDSIDFSGLTTPRYYIGARNTGSAVNFFNGRLGNVFFDTSYIDLSQPTNLAKFVTGTGIDAKPVDMGANGELPTGTSPLIYLPMYGNNAGKNYGTGGDFTVNSGPFPGARGPNEFWGNKADFDGSTGLISRTSALSGVSDGKAFSCSFFVNADTLTNNPSRIFIMRKVGNLRFYIRFETTGALTVTAANTSGTEIFNASVASAIVAGSSYHFLIAADMASSSTRAIYINGAAASVTWTTYTNDSISLTGDAMQIGGTSGGTYLDGKLSEFYFTTSYIDFSQEANRLKFRDAFGNPTDLPAAIAAGTVPNPAIYMRFDPANQGLNSGTGGNFVKSGTIADGGQL